MKTIKIVYNTIVVINLITFITKSALRSKKEWHARLIKMYETRAAHERLEFERIHAEEDHPIDRIIRERYGDSSGTGAKP